MAKGFAPWKNVLKSLGGYFGSDAIYALAYIETREMCRSVQRDSTLCTHRLTSDLQYEVIRGCAHNL